MRAVRFDKYGPIDVLQVVSGEGSLHERFPATFPSGQGSDALIDLVGGGYVDLALGNWVDPQRIDTIVDFAAAEKGVKAEGDAAGASAAVLAEGHPRGKIVLIP